MEQICRICLRPTKPLLSLFDDTQLSEKIKVVSSVVIKQRDGFPTTVCAECIINIHISYNFRLLIINSDLELRRRAEDTATEVEEPIQADNSESVLKISEMIKSQLDDLEGRSNGQAEPVVESEEEVTNKKFYTCSKCNFVTENLSASLRHERNAHRLKKTRVCSICGKVVEVSNYVKHMRNHETAPCKCDICGKMCKNRESLRYHRFVHKEPRVCEHCGSTFTYQSSYRLHIMKFHKGGLQKVPCTFCDKLFFRGSELKKHMRRHTGERPYSCEICEKGFSSPNALKTHQRQHTNERPYVCDQCGVAFKQKVSLRQHCKTKHSKSEVTLI